MDFEKLLDELAQGDREAFQRFYDRYGLPVYRYILEKTGDPARTKQLWKNVFRTLMSRLHETQTADLPLLLLTAFADVQIASELPAPAPQPEEQAHRLSSELMDELHGTAAHPATAHTAPAHIETAHNAPAEVGATKPDASDRTEDDDADYAPRRVIPDPGESVSADAAAGSPPDSFADAASSASILRDAECSDAVPADAASADSQPQASAHTVGVPAQPDSSSAYEPDEPSAAAIAAEGITSPVLLSQSPVKKKAGLITLLVLLILLALVLLWGGIGYAMGSGLLPFYDLGYSWFNQTIYTFFPLS